MGPNEVKRFWSKIDKTEGCWLWNAALDGRGYGKFVIWRDKKHKYLIASRVAWELTYGKIPTGKSVLHRCDTPRCINPAHLFLGSTKDNMLDMKSKGRHQYRVGLANPNARISDTEVVQIRSLRAKGISASKIASDYNITTGTVYNMCNPRQGYRTGKRGTSKELREMH